MSAKSSPSEWWVDLGPACRARFESTGESYEEATCRNIPVTDVADAVQKGPRGQHNLLAFEVLPLARDHSLHRLVPTVHLKFLCEILPSFLHEPRLQRELGWGSFSPLPACTSCTSHDRLGHADREPR